jgi:hypothetical protein
MNTMKNILYKFLTVALAVLAIACADDSLDPLQLKDVRKGTILALRGTQLQNIYFLGKPGAEFFPRIIEGDETFDFDAEILAEDPSTLASFDVFAIKRIPQPDGTVTLERKPLVNVPASAFKQTPDFLRPWVSVSIKLTDILTALGLDYTNDDDVETMLSVYRFGIAIESDLNLTDGTKVLASDIIASGLFQSNQFYPAQRLTYTVTDYCTYDASTWAGTYDATESSEFFGGYGPYDVNMTQDAGNPNRFNLDNWYDSGIPIYIIFEESFDVASQIVEAPPQKHPNGVRTISGKGTYNQCTNEITMDFLYVRDSDGEVLDKLVWKLVKQQ